MCNPQDQYTGFIHFQDLTMMPLYFICLDLVLLKLSLVSTETLRVGMSRTHAGHDEAIVERKNIGMYTMTPMGS